MVGELVLLVDETVGVGDFEVGVDLREGVLGFYEVFAVLVVGLLFGVELVVEGVEVEFGEEEFLDLEEGVGVGGVEGVFLLELEHEEVAEFQGFEEAVLEPCFGSVGFQHCLYPLLDFNNTVLLFQKSEFY